jgi:hypothetical protein
MPLMSRLGFAAQRSIAEFNKSSITLSGRQTSAVSYYVEAAETSRNYRLAAE